MQAMESNPLISVIVLSYKNVQYMNECLASIFFQTYDNIELIVTNDGAEEFDEQAVSQYVNQKRTDSIKRLVINKNEKNVGTVKHCNIALNLTSGDYVMFIACDDVYSNNEVIANLVKGFDIAPAGTMSIVGQTAMYDNQLSKIYNLYVTEERKQAINQLEPEELYRERLAYDCVFPAASRIFKREVFEKYGKFDERYFLVEDWTSSISQCKQGMKSYYIDVMCVNHREGGVSTNNFDPKNRAQKLFVADMIMLFENNLKDANISKVSKQRANDKLDWYKYQYYRNYIMPTQSAKHNMLFLLKRENLSALRRLSMGKFIRGKQAIDAKLNKALIFLGSFLLLYSTGIIGEFIHPWVVGGLIIGSSVTSTMVKGFYKTFTMLSLFYFINYHFDLSDYLRDPDTILLALNIGIISCILLFGLKKFIAIIKKIIKYSHTS